MGSIPIARSITHDDSIVLTPLNSLISAIKPGILVARWIQRNKLVPTCLSWTPPVKFEVSTVEMLQTRRPPTVSAGLKSFVGVARSGDKVTK